MEDEVSLHSFPDYSLVLPSPEANPETNNNRPPNNVHPFARVNNYLDGYANIHFKDSRFLFDTLKPLSVFKEKVVCSIDPSGIEFVHEVAAIYQLRIFIEKRYLDDFDFSPGPRNVEKYLFALSIGQFLKGIDFLEPSMESKQKATSFVLPLRAEHHDRSFRKLPDQPRDLYINYFEDNGNLLLNSTVGTVHSETSLVTYNCGPLSSNFFFTTTSMSSIVIKAYCMKEALMAFDTTCETVEFKLSPEYPHFTISGIGISWEVETLLPSNDNVCESFTCDVMTKGRYKLAHILLLIPGLTSADRVFVCLNNQGFMSVKFIGGEDLSIEAAEFICAPSI